MAMEPDAPADTTMMRIVHEALRRDLRRAQSALGEHPPPGAARLRTLAEHLVWIMQFLTAHHRSEDEGLYPLVRHRAEQRAPDVLDLLDRMGRQHEAVACRIAAVESAAVTLGAGGDNTVGAMLAAIEELARSLLPHLQQEEEDVMPAVSGLITNAEWEAIEQQYNLDPKSFIELGREAHWLIDDASDEDRATVLGLVPPVPRFILLHGFARRYRRQREACWGAPSRPPRQVQKTGRVAVPVEADIDSVWDVVRDVTRVGEWSHECVGAVWLADATAATPGARFRGRNRAGLFRWGRICEIVAVDPYQLVWRTVPTTLYPDSSEWTITLDATETGTTIEQRFRVIRAPQLLDRLYALVIPAHRDRNEALTDDLRRLGKIAQRPPRGQLPHASNMP